MLVFIFKRCPLLTCCQHNVHEAIHYRCHIESGWGHHHRYQSKLATLIFIIYIRYWTFLVFTWDDAFYVFLCLLNSAQLQFQHDCRLYVGSLWKYQRVNGWLGITIGWSLRHFLEGLKEIRILMALNDKCKSLWVYFCH